MRPAFGCLDERVLDAMAPDLADARVVLDVGAGAGELSRCLAARHPRLTVVGLEPSAAFVVSQRPRLRGRAEALPLATASVDVAVCLTSLRHVADRGAALHELRRVVRPVGVLWLVEVDRAAAAARIRRHTDGMSSRRARLVFRWLVLPLCPLAAQFAAQASLAGWRPEAAWPDPEQPFFVMRLR